MVNWQQLVLIARLKGLKFRWQIPYVENLAVA